ncbi:MAG: ABC transporter ATP-binding protein, partial [Gaiellaceae bacterium]
MAAAPYRRTFGRLLGFLRPYKWSLVVSIVLAVLSQAAQFATAFLTGAGLGSAVEGHDKHALKLIVAAVIGVGIARALFRGARRLISGQQALGVEFDLRSAL